MRRNALSHCLPEGITFTTQAQIDSFAINYPGCTEIEGDVTIGPSGDITNLYGLSVLTSIGGKLGIVEHDALTSLTGMENLSTIGGYLQITGNNFLGSLTGLDSLASIGGYLKINSNSSLISLSGLDNLTSIEGYLEISYNYNLTSLSGLDNVDAASINSLSIIDNHLLSECDAESICNYLSAPTGSVSIYGNATGCNNPAQIASECGFIMDCMPYGNYYFYTQADIDNFQANYPGCSALKGDVWIFGGSITNLDGLVGVTSIEGNLSMWEYIHSLTSISGLENLTSIGGNFDINSNSSLTSLTGLENLTSIGGDFNIDRNNALTSLTGLENLASIGGSLFIGVDDGWKGGGNDSLTSLTGLENLTTIGGILQYTGTMP